MNVQRGNTSSSRFADHVWEAQHRVLWHEAKLISKEKKWFKQRFKKAAFISTNNCIGQVIREIPNICFVPFIMHFVAGL